jgi:hypothetical protein
MYLKIMQASKSYFIVGLILCLVLSTVVIAGEDDIRKSLNIPEDDVKQIITLEDGSTLVGRTAEIRDNDILFETDMGVMTIEISKIREFKEVSSSSFKEGKYWFPNPNRTRLYFSPTGRMLNAGEGYFSDIYLFFPSVTFGITDNITLGGGFSLFPGVAIEEQAFYFTPKIGINTGSDLDFAISGYIFQIPGADHDIIGILFGSATFGSDDKSLTFGLGYGFVKDDFADKPAVILGGEYRLARRLSFVSENAIIPSVDPPVISYGIRFLGESLSVDLALGNVLNDNVIFPGLPYIDFVWNF